MSGTPQVEPTIPPAWEPVRDVPAEVEDALGVWHWGNTAYGFSWTGSELVAMLLADGNEAHRWALRDGRFVGTRGYHHGERLDVVRRDDGSVSHLVCATFVYTRVPYDSHAPIPGGPPTRLEPPAAR